MICINDRREGRGTDGDRRRLRRLRGDDREDEHVVERSVGHSSGEHAVHHGTERRRRYADTCQQDTLLSSMCPINSFV